MITPLLAAFEPWAPDSRLPLLKLPGGHIVYLNSFRAATNPLRLDHVAIALVIVYLGKAVAEYFGIVEIQ